MSSFIRFCTMWTEESLNFSNIFLFEYDEDFGDDEEDDDLGDDDLGDDEEDDDLGDDLYEGDLDDLSDGDTDDDFDDDFIIIYKNIIFIMLINRNN